jgi:hypothetical protein
LAAKKSGREAVEGFLDAIRLVASCITSQPIHVSWNTRAQRMASLSFIPFGQPVALRRERDHIPLFLVFRLDVRVEHDADVRFTITSASYSYRILDRGGHELLAFHWHPVGLSPVIYPHVHLSSRIRPVPIEPAGATVALANMHIPTGLVRITDIVRLLITEFGVQPRRTDWATILTSATTAVSPSP